MARHEFSPETKDKFFMWRQGLSNSGTADYIKRVLYLPVLILAVVVMLEFFLPLGSMFFCFIPGSLVILGLFVLGWLRGENE